MRFFQKSVAILFVLCLVFALGGCQKLQQAADAVTAKEFSLGTVSGNHYENDFVGIQCDLASDWVIYDEEGISELTGVLYDSFTEAEAKKMVEESGSAMIFYAQNPSTFSTINITVSDTESYSMAMGDHKKLIDTMVTKMPELLEQAYMTNVTCTAETFSFCGEDNYGIYTTASVYELPLFERQVILVEGTYSITLTVCAYHEDTTMELLDLIKPYEG